ncbi:hypothetical protein [Methylobacterium sp. WL116]|uniref:hypothetical protein n=1 Tax=Methylobacterium sp. WL116 TaxID=2603889 RepID=UPI00165004E2|nr:hypothetical protein [Methylobacterium sp. WL116]
MSSARAMGWEPFTGAPAAGITPLDLFGPRHKRHTLEMRAEIEQASDAAKQSIGLLRRHL